MYIKNWISNRTKTVVQNDVCNGYDAWRKLMKDQMPLAAVKQIIWIREFMALRVPADGQGIRKEILEIERVTGQWARLARLLEASGP